MSNANERRIKMYTLYAHIAPNDKIYIGITGKTVEERWRNNGSGYAVQRLFYRAIQKYGWDNIKHIVLLENLSKEVACECEKYLISKFQTNNPKHGYNVYVGGDCGPLGIAMSDETKEKLRQLNLGKRRSVETIEKIKQNHAHFNRGRHITEEQKQKISQANKGKIAWNKGKKLSDEYRQKLSQSHLGHIPWNKGVPGSEEMKQKVSKANRGNKAWNKGLKLSEQQKQQIRESLKNRIWVNNGEHRTLINVDELQAYLDKGYSRGRGHKS